MSAFDDAKREAVHSALSLAALMGDAELAMMAAYLLTSERGELAASVAYCLREASRISHQRFDALTDMAMERGDVDLASVASVITETQRVLQSMRALLEQAEPSGSECGEAPCVLGVGSLRAIERENERGVFDVFEAEGGAKLASGLSRADAMRAVHT